GDRDAFQLASNRTTILHPVRAGEMARIGPAEVRERYGVEPRQVPDFIALRGDPSDRLPGARGVGPKGAAALLRKYATLEEAFADGQLTSASIPARAQSSSSCEVPPPTPQAPSTTPLRMIGTAPCPMIMWSPSALAMPRGVGWSARACISPLVRPKAAEATAFP